LSKIKHFLTEKPLEMAVHAFISSHLDYCNSLYCSISKSQLAQPSTDPKCCSKI